MQRIPDTKLDLYRRCAVPDDGPESIHDQVCGLYSRNRNCFMINFLLRAVLPAGENSHQSTHNAYGCPGIIHRWLERTGGDFRDDNQSETWVLLKAPHRADRKRISQRLQRIIVVGPHASRCMIHSTSGAGTKRHLRSGPAITLR